MLTNPPCDPLPRARAAHVLVAPTAAPAASSFSATST